MTNIPKHKTTNEGSVTGLSNARIPGSIGLVVSWSVGRRGFVRTENTEIHRKSMACGTARLLL